MLKSRAMGISNDKSSPTVNTERKTSSFLLPFISWMGKHFDARVGFVSLHSFVYISMCEYAVGWLHAPAASTDA